MEKEKGQRYAREPVHLDYVVRMDVGKVQNPWYEDVDLEPLKAGFVTVGAPVQDLPSVIGIPCPDSVELVVLTAKSSLDCLRAAWVRGEAKDIEVLTQTVDKRVDVCAFLGVSAATYLWLATFAACVEFTRHPSDKATVLHSNLIEGVDSGPGDVENLPVTRHAWEGAGGTKLAPGEGEII